MSDEIERIRRDHIADPDGDPNDPHCVMCSDASYPIWPCDAAILLALLAERDADVARLVVREAVLERAVEKAADWHSLPPHEFEGKWGRGWEDSPDADGLIASDLRAALAARGGEG